MKDVEQTKKRVLLYKKKLVFKKKYLLDKSTAKKTDDAVEYVRLNKVQVVELFVLIDRYYQIEQEIVELVMLSNDHDEMINRNNNLV
jgi:hypothetical protein